MLEKLCREEENLPVTNFYQQMAIYRLLLSKLVGFNNYIDFIHV